jgi:probable rRNA maturation factor
MIKVNMFGRMPSGVSRVLLQRASHAVDRELGKRRELQMGLRFISEREMEKLNHRYRGLRRATDVLSFSGEAPVPWSKMFSTHRNDELGDVVIAPAYAKREARRRAIDFSEEIVRLMIHGMLHLFGFDHAKEREEASMFALQEKLVDQCFDDE